MKKWNTFKKIMVISAISTSIFTILFFALYKIIGIEILKVLSITFLTIAFHFDIRLIIGNIVPLFKNKININSKYFKLKKYEEIVYKKIKVKSWKAKVPTYNDKEFDIKTHSLDEIVRNMCNSEIIHTIDLFISYIPLLLIICFGSPIVFTLTSILASLFDLQFVIIQRYNRPRVIKIIEDERNIQNMIPNNKQKRSN